MARTPKLAHGKGGYLVTLDRNVLDPLSQLPGPLFGICAEYLFLGTVRGLYQYAGRRSA